MIALIDWILSLFRSEDAARAFVAAPEQALRDAGLAGVSAAQLSSVAATAVPGLVLGGGDPILGLQRVVANEYGFTPSFDPVWAPSPTFAPETNTDLASNNDVGLLSPTQGAGANAQNGAFNLGFGDITLGDKTSTSASNGGVVVSGDSSGDIVSGDGAVLGDANAVTNGDIRADHGSNISTGQDNAIQDSGTTTTAGGDAIATADSGTVIKGTENSYHDGASNVVAGSQTTTTVGGTDNITMADGSDASSTSTTTEVTDNSVHDSSDHSLFDANLMSNNDTVLDSDTALASGNHLGLLGF